VIPYSEKAVIFVSQVGLVWHGKNGNLVSESKNGTEVSVQFCGVQTVCFWKYPLHFIATQMVEAGHTHSQDGTSFHRGYEGNFSFTRALVVGFFLQVSVG
jgi:hypothetical protein